MTTHAKKLFPALLFFVVLAIENAPAYYDPGVQRWLGRDPLQEAGGINLYAFVGSSPVRRCDSYGLDFVVYPTPEGGFPPINPDQVTSICASLETSVRDLSRAIQVITAAGMQPDPELLANYGMSLALYNQICNQPPPPEPVPCPVLESPLQTGPRWNPGLDVPPVPTVFLEELLAWLFMASEGGGL